MKPTLLVLAAGMGSRYGGLKQLDPMGPSGETLLDYSVFDALHGGFGRVVFRHPARFEEQFRHAVGRKFEARTDVSYVFQELDKLPGGLHLPATPAKALGHRTRDLVRARGTPDPPSPPSTPMISTVPAPTAPSRISLPRPATGNNEADPAEFAMIGYQLDRTLSEHGSVARGVCAVDDAGMLNKIEEFTGIERDKTGVIRSPRPDGSIVEFTGAEPVSMNFWGFTPALFPAAGNWSRAFPARQARRSEGGILHPARGGRNDRRRHRARSRATDGLRVVRRYLPRRPTGRRRGAGGTGRAEIVPYTIFTTGCFSVSPKSRLAGDFIASPSRPKVRNSRHQGRSKRNSCAGAHLSMVLPVEKS